MTTRDLDAENEQLRRIVDAARNVAFYPPAERGRANKAYVSWMLIDKLRAALSPPSASEQTEPNPNFWQPISSAPKDGTLFVALSQDTLGNGLPPFVSLCSWHPDAGFCTDELREPTHWMAVPNLHSSSASEQSEDDAKGMAS